MNHSMLLCKQSPSKEKIMEKWEKCVNTNIVSIDQIFEFRMCTSRLLIFGSFRNSPPRTHNLTSISLTRWLCFCTALPTFSSICFVCHKRRVHYSKHERKMDVVQRIPWIYLFIYCFNNKIRHSMFMYSTHLILIKFKIFNKFSHQCLQNLSF